MQRRSLEDSLTMYKQQVGSLEEKFAMSAQEINKGNQIIQKLRMDAKQLKGKLRVKVDALTQQEKSVQDLERAEENGRHVAVEKEQELSRSKEREERLQQDVEDFRKRLAEAHEVVRSNQDVIEYLNRQLAERDLKALPPVLPAGSGGMERETRSSPLSDLLKRTEGLGKSVKSNGISGGSSLSNNLGFNSTGLSELGLMSGLSTFTGTRSSMLGISDPSNLLALGGSGANATNTASALTSIKAGADIYGLVGATSPQLGCGAKLGDMLGSSPMSVAASLTAGQSPLQGPVAYRSPSTSPPLAVK
jgi:hypothetical protein